MVENEIEQPLQKQETAKAKFHWKTYVQENRNAVIIGGVVVVLIVLGTMYYRSMQHEKEQAAGLALSRISSYVEANDFEKALNGDPTKKVRGNEIMGLLAIVEQYGSTGAGKTAALEAAVAEMALQKFDAAEKHFDMATGSESAFVRAGGYAGLAACQEKKSAYAEAAKLYEKAAGISEHINNKDKYQYYAAMCFEKANDKESAIKLYKNIILEFEFSEFSSEARAGLTRLGTVVD